MEKIIILLLIVVILLLLSDKMPITHSKKRTPRPKATPIPQTAPSTSVMGESRFVPPAKVATTAIPLTEKEQQDILTEWEEEPTINLEDEEEDLRSYRTEAEDNDFATGLSFEDLEKEIQDTQDELSKMLGELTGSEADLAGIRELQKLLSGREH